MNKINLGEQLSKYTGVQIEQVKEMLAQPKLNKQNIGQLAKVAYSTGKEMSMNTKKTVTSNAQLNKAKKETKKFGDNRACILCVQVRLLCQFLRFGGLFGKELL